MKPIPSRLQKITIPTIAPAGTVECVCVWGGGGYVYICSVLDRAQGKLDSTIYWTDLQ